MKYACPCCGFLTLSEPFSYDICEICDWEDDPIQQENPALELGPNHNSLINEQFKILKTLPPNITEYKGKTRDSEWRPLLPEECTLPTLPHKTGMDYFNIASGGMAPFRHYWKESNSN